MYADINIRDKTSSNSFLATPVYTIAAGPRRKEFLVHSGLLFADSDSLQELVTAQWKSSRDRTIEWEQFEEDTVTRYVQWLYTKEYQVPAPKPALVKSRRASGVDTVTGRQRSSSKVFAEAIRNSFAPSPPTTPSPPSSVLSDPASSNSHSSDSAPSPHSAHLPANDSVPAHVYAPLYIPDIPAPTAPATPIDPSTPLDYEEPFLAHAKLYVLAQYTGTTSLKIQCNSRLASLLDEIRWIERSSAVAENFVKLARFVYHHTQSPSNKEESMRLVISSFAAFNFESLDCSSMMSLMGEGGDFVTDVVKKVMKGMRKQSISSASGNANPHPAPVQAPVKISAASKKTLLEAMKHKPMPSSSAQSTVGIPYDDDKGSVVGRVRSSSINTVRTTTSTPHLKATPSLRQKPPTIPTSALASIPGSRSASPMPQTPTKVSSKMPLKPASSTPMAPRVASSTVGSPGPRLASSASSTVGASPLLRRSTRGTVEALKAAPSPGLERKGSIARISTAPSLERKGSIARIATTSSPALERKGSIARIATTSTLERRPSAARLSFGGQ
ncbi:Similar to hypothetical protein FOXB_16873 [Fusarium oxysporum Fo5176]; acc. no. EGU72617 [Pyronema omphalodes CBS 100304]|uniref:BTB domain-containing protein n=1 Tax=Pyronema omphalodes (strain CBS 100304) TaxID=1076935 RepID=U4LJ78_PYROM|nr:Similar to hypothetical protein FOXB_16873 [Fusarium oxysporum Fo5176]; acc. no. EGU72617 [Pyronema omphalodes CBS 100304]